MFEFRALPKLGSFPLKTTKQDEEGGSGGNGMSLKHLNARL
jgi:hypothetical protein